MLRAFFSVVKKQDMVLLFFILSVGKFPLILNIMKSGFIPTYDPEVIEFLLNDEQFEEDLPKIASLKDKFGNTALHYSVKSGVLQTNLTV
jgi:hypothetical protein